MQNSTLHITPLIKGTKGNPTSLELKIDSSREVSLLINDPLYKLDAKITKAGLKKLHVWLHLLNKHYSTWCETIKSMTEHSLQMSSNGYTIKVKIVHQPYGDENKHLCSISIGQCKILTNTLDENGLLEFEGRLSDALKLLNDKSANNDSEKEDLLN